MTGLKEGDGRVMVDGLGVHRFDDAEIVGDLGCVWEEFAEPGSALAVLGELENRGGNRKRFLAGGHSGDPLAHADRVGKVF